MSKLADDFEVEKAKIPSGVKRSDHWPAARAAHLNGAPTCAVCGGAKNLEVHHIHPFHLHPELELDQSNFVTLCEEDIDGVNCHLLFGHLGNFKSFNVDVLADAAHWLAKIQGRPLEETP